MGDGPNTAAKYNNIQLTMTENWFVKPNSVLHAVQVFSSRYTQTANLVADVVTLR